MADDAKIAFELYQHLGQSVIDFFRKKRAEVSLEEGQHLDINAKELITAILSFASTELSMILSTSRVTPFGRGDVSDCVTGIIKPFRMLLDRDLNELIKKSSHH